MWWLRQLLGIIFSCSFVISEPAWFQVCDKEQRYQLNSEDCALGLWFKRSLEVDCVCVNGVWAISNGLCDEDFQILVGAGDCFTINNEIRSVKLIGNVENPFAQATYVATAELDSFVKVPTDDYNPVLDSLASIVISVNLTDNILQRSDREICLQVEEAAAEKPVHIWKNFRRESNRFKLVKDMNCVEPVTFSYSLGFGESFQDGSIKRFDTLAQNCVSHCMTLPGKNKFRPTLRPLEKPKVFTSRRKGLQPRGRATASKTSAKTSSSSSSSGIKKSKIYWDDLYSINTKLSFTNGDGLTAEKKKEKQNIYLHRFNMTERWLTFVRETREQTVRMLQAQTNFLLLGEPTVQINTYEYDYFQLARQLFTSIVPPDIVPSKVVNGLTRMWRQLLWESHDKFKHVEHPNQEQHFRIKKSLESCLVNVSSYPMVFIDIQNHSSHACLNKTTTTFWNETEDDKKPGNAKAIFLSSSTIPKGVKFDTDKLDFVVEMAWKISMFAHYHCSRWFHARGYDHSQMTSKLMSLFNSKVAKRWHNPQDSLLVYKTLFAKHDFDRIAFATDRVVEAARDNSDYAQWLLRPKIPLSPEDAITNPREKREARRNREPKQYPLWGRKAACMNSFTDPTDKFHYKSKSNCFVSPVPAQK